ncbi:hypothetical protein M569_10307 [Genlisea aurea]|uniref:Uncharacterized protein n=1 Tax=Genlisea aurea TaxID=192259 RepID=S8CBZ4_9LAMI|nr:hypothetical protein M569_10307 [Genlisea aurea]
MAVIEEEPSVDIDLKSWKIPAAGTGNVSDSYETASETELDDDDVTEPEKRLQSSDENGSGCSHSVNPGVNEARCEAKEEEQPEKSEDVEVLKNYKALARADDAKLDGNSLFKSGSYEEALSKYEFALQIAPQGSSSSELRSMCHANRAACFLKLEKYDETIKECSKALELKPEYVKAISRRAEAQEKLEHYDESIADLNKILELDPDNDVARRNIIRLKPIADEKREKMKEEMIGKLKEMGNSILGRFGMSVDNFKAVKDPNSGSYSISFQR